MIFLRLYLTTLDTKFEWLTGQNVSLKIIIIWRWWNKTTCIIVKRVKTCPTCPLRYSFFFLLFHPLFPFLCLIRRIKCVNLITALPNVCSWCVTAPSVFSSRVKAPSHDTSLSTMDEWTEQPLCYFCLLLLSYDSLQKRKKKYFRRCIYV